LLHSADVPVPSSHKLHLFRIPGLLHQLGFFRRRVAEIIIRPSCLRICRTSDGQHDKNQKENHTPSHGSPLRFPWISGGKSPKKESGPEEGTPQLPKVVHFPPHFSSRQSPHQTEPAMFPAIFAR